MNAADIYGVLAGCIGLLNAIINFYIWKYERSAYRVVAATSAIVGIFAALAYILVAIGPSLGWFARGTLTPVYRGSSAIVEGLLLVQGAYVLRILRVLKHGTGNN